MSRYKPLRAKLTETTVTSEGERKRPSVTKQDVEDALFLAFTDQAILDYGPSGVPRGHVFDKHQQELLKQWEAKSCE